MAPKKRKHGGGAASKAKKKNKKAVGIANANARARDEAEAAAAAATAGEEGEQQQQQQQSGKEEQTEALDPASAVLSEELRAELGGDDVDMMVIVGSKKKQKTKKEAPVTEEELQAVQKMSRSKRKKLEQLAERKVKEARREGLYKSLADKSISQSQLDLLYTTARLGHKETLRERLKRAMNRQKAGIELTEVEASELVQQRTTPASHDDEEEESDEDENDEEERAGDDTSAVGDTASAETASKKKKKKNKAKTGPSDSSSTGGEPLAKPLASSTPVEQDNGNKKKRRKRATVSTSIVPMMMTVTAASTTLSADVEMTATKEEDPSTPTAPASGSIASQVLASMASGESDSSALKLSSSQNDAMTRLAALKKKNEERRREKELAKAGGAVSKEAPSTEDVSMPVEKAYVPVPIMLKTTKEMQELSQSVAPISYKTTLVKLSRKPEIQMARMQLPVCSSEQEIMEAISLNDVVILCGETGSGKTTQVPQFLYEAGYGHPKHELHSGRIGVTQPRRVAAVSTAKRVAEELNVTFGREVGYQIRYDAAHVGDHTRVKFMTDGILLKEIQQDFLLRQYSILLLDEAHERNVNTDILIGLLSRIAPLRAQMAQEERASFDLLSPEEQDAHRSVHRPLMPLKLVIMSATLRVEDFTENTRLFPKPPPVLRVEARQYPVTVHFNKRTELNDYVGEAFQKVVKIHKKLPEGGVLVFLTGQREILQLCRQLKRVYSESAARNKKLKRSSRQERPARDGEDATTADATATATASNSTSKESERAANPTSDRVLLEHDDLEEAADLEDDALYGEQDDPENDNDEEEDDDDEEGDEEDEEDELAIPYMHVLPLYSLLAQEEQLRVFAPPPSPRHRLIVVATNVAETSLTIPGIKYVVDAGRTKERVFDLASGISRFDVQWVSKASADQRAGRAGRTGPGHCYRLYSSAVYDTDFAKFAAPEILGQPIEDLALQMKAMGIHRLGQFPFPTPPEAAAIQQALTTLEHLGAVTTSRHDDNDEGAGESEAITPLGRVLVRFPVAARFAKMLLLAKELGVLEYTIAMVAGLSGHSPFVNALDRREKEQDEQEEATWAADPSGAKKEDDHHKTESMEEELAREWREAEQLRRHVQWVDPESDVLSLLRAAGAYAFAGGSSEFCRSNHLHDKTMQHMLQLRQQLTRIVNQMYPTEPAITLSPRLAPPSAETQVVLRQVVLVGFLDQVARRAAPGTITEGSKLERSCGYLTASSSIREPVYLHPHSHVFTPDASKLPAMVCYQHVQRSSRAYLRTVTAIEPAWLSALARHTPLCRYSAPLTEPSPTYNAVHDRIECFVKVQYGVHQWSLPAVRVSMADALAKQSKTKPTDTTTTATEDKATVTTETTQVLYRWFAKCVLDGHVITGLAPFAHALREPSYLLIRKQFDAKIQLLVAQLQRAGVSTRAALVARWKHGEPSFLLDALLSWYTREQRAAVTKAWPRIVAKAILDEH